MKVSIIIPTYNHLEDCLKPCIESIIKFTEFNDIEILIVSNGSTDNTKEYVTSLGSPFILIKDEKPLGYAKAVNRGIQESKGDYIVLLNNDTVLLDQKKNAWIEMLLKPFEEVNDLGITGPLQLYDNYCGQKVMIFFCVMIKKQLFNEIGFLDESYGSGGEDIDFCVKARGSKYYRQLVVPDTNVRNGVGHFPIWHKGEGTLNHKDHPEYGNVTIKQNGMKNMIKYHPQLAADRKIRLNFGSGGVDVPGFISIDKYDKRAKIQMDVFDFKILLPNFVEEIMAIHLFEHINPFKSSDVLKIWYDLLIPGGTLILEMPDIKQVCQAFINAKDKWERYSLMNVIYGSVNTSTTDNPSDITSPHLFGWWPETLGEHLSGTGFVDIKFGPEQFPHPGFNFRAECKKPYPDKLSSLSDFKRKNNA